MGPVRRRHACHYRITLRRESHVGKKSGYVICFFSRPRELASCLASSQVRAFTLTNHGRGGGDGRGLGVGTGLGVDVGVGVGVGVNVAVAVAVAVADAVAVAVGVAVAGAV